MKAPVQKKKNEKNKSFPHRTIVAEAASRGAALRQVGRIGRDLEKKPLPASVETVASDDDGGTVRLEPLESIRAGELL